MFGIHASFLEFWSNSEFYHARDKDIKNVVNQTVYPKIKRIIIYLHFIPYSADLQKELLGRMMSVFSFCMQNIFICIVNNYCIITVIVLY